ncbi:MAG: 1-acyl-sn-glycerol-3-phosphate acyltransferase [SAR324 cluster bacterium]|nr:1-acyl-sn-glycerol-3-phosphate acyltransferase [SAR324 cluster bacterium]
MTINYKTLQWWLVWIKTIFVTIRVSILTIINSWKIPIDRETNDRRVRQWAQSILDFVRLTYTVYGSVNYEPGKSYIIMSNHASHFDIPLLFVALPGSIRMMAKKELFSIPIWGRGMYAGEIIPIDRKNRDQARKDLEYASGKMKDGIIVWVSPEGTRTRSGKLQKFKKGGFILALQTGATIIPVGIRGCREVWPAKSINVETDRHVEVHIGTPVEASAYSIEQRNDLVDVVFKQIRELADLEAE